MPQNSQAVAINDTIQAADHNKVVTDISELFASTAVGTLAPTFSGRRLTQLDVGADRWILNWSNGRIATAVFQSPAGTLKATYTPTYTGRKITAWTKS